jgi:lipopolysaccharide biosynthesis glycosyltransferase
VKERIVIFDSDVIVKGPLSADIFDVSQVKVRFNRDHDHSQHDAHFHRVGEYLRSRGCATRVDDFNSGFVILNRCVLDPKAVEEFWTLLARHGELHHLMEQDAYAVLASLWRSEPLPDSFMVGARSWERESRRSAVTLHFTTAVRYWDWTYLREGLRFLLRYVAARQ